jgi:hypothetical protein
LVQDPIKALSKVSRSRATSSAGKALPGEKGLAIIGAISDSSIASSTAYAAPAPGERRG